MKLRTFSLAMLLAANIAIGSDAFAIGTPDKPSPGYGPPLTKNVDPNRDSPNFGPLRPFPPVRQPDQKKTQNEELNEDVEQVVNPAT